MSDVVHEIVAGYDGSADSEQALDWAAPQAQLRVVGARGRGGLRGMVLGSVSLAILHYAPCQVIVVRQR
jgi:universal stress protein family protein